MRKTLQDKIFENIQSKFSKRSELVEELSGLLGIGKDAVYRRLRGDTLLTPDEISHLALQYNISLDILVHEKKDKVLFTYNSFSKKINNYTDYLIDVRDQAQRVSKIPNAKAYYASYDIPFLYFCFFPELVSFKLFVWGLTIFEFDYLKKETFDFNVISYPDMKIIEEITHAFKAFHSTELWSLNIIDNTLNQIEYFVSSGKFKNENDALILCDKLIALTEHWQSMAEHGQKFLPGTSPDTGRGSFDLYHNELLITSSTILVTSPTIKMLYAIFVNPNYLFCTDSNFGTYQEEWFKKAISKSESISKHAERKRNRFFNTLRQKINNGKSRIENQIRNNQI